MKNTVSITGMEVPMPEKAAPNLGTKFFVLGVSSVMELTWTGHLYDEELLNANRVWLKKASAQAAFDAITKLLGGDQ